MGSAYSATESLFFAIDPELERDRSAASEFWEPYGETPDKFVQGFAEGALDIWAEVESQL